MPGEEEGMENTEIWKAKEKPIDTNTAQDTKPRNQGLETHLVRK